MRRRLFLLLLVVTLVRGIVYLVVIPPWQHHDEPTHFEYASLIALERKLPQAGEYDLEMRREIAASMAATDFWKQIGAPTPDLWSSTPPAIGFAELEHPPVYYALVAVPLLLVQGQDVETQLYVARLVSILLYVLVVGAAYGLLIDAFPNRRWLPLAVATFLAFLPTFADLMSSVNSDVGAVAATTLLLWSAIRVLRYGLSLKRVAVTLALAGLCVLTKSTAAMTAVVILAVVAMALVPNRPRRWVWIGPGLLAVMAVAATLTWGGNAAQWYNLRPAAAENRIITSTPLGRAAFVLSGRGEAHARLLLQELEKTEGERLRGQTVTLGAWLRAAEGSVNPVTLIVHDGSDLKEHQVVATEDWQFHAFSASIGDQAKGLSVRVSASPGDDGPGIIYLDGIVLVEGEMQPDQVPEFDTAQARQGQWGTRGFENLLRNASAEKAWPGLRGSIGNEEIYRQPIGQVFQSLMDWPRNGWAYGEEARRLHNGFWGKFGWSSVVLYPSYFYPLWLITILGIAGTGLALVRLLRSDRKIASWQRWAWILMGAVWLAAWGAVFVRIHPLLLTHIYYWPTARYAAVAIVPTVTILCLGLAELTPRRWQGWLALLGLIGLITLDVVSLLTAIVPHYYG